jgi:hypothetical protein
MLRGPSLSPFDGQHSERVRIGRRFALALLASLLVHATLGRSIKGGSIGTHASPPERAVLTARLARTDPPPPERAPETIEPVVLRHVRRAPPVTAPEARVPDKEAPEREAPPPPAGSGLPEAPDLTYYGTRQLDVYPQLATALDLKATRHAATNAAARALLLVLINALGTVDEVSVVEAEPPDELDDTRRALMSARFTPAYRNGKPVRSRLLVEITFGDDSAAR